jgi:hypothetical protein
MCSAVWRWQWVRAWSATHSLRACFLVFGLAASVVAGGPQVVFAGELAGGKCADRGLALSRPISCCTVASFSIRRVVTARSESFEVGVGVVGVAE